MMSRRYDLDWLRVLAVLLLVPFHTALIFSLNPRDMVYIKDRVESVALLNMDGFIYPWHMPLLFLIAGAATWFALGKRSAGEYVRERILRLIIPALFAFATLIPFMTYFHNFRVPNAPSFWNYYPDFFRLNFADLSGYHGTFTPAHLWFVLFLFVFALAALPLFYAIRRHPQQIERFANLFSLPGVILVLPIIVLALLDRLPALVDKNPFYFYALFAFGFVLVANPRFQAAIERQTYPILIVTVIMTAVYFGFREQSNSLPEYSPGAIGLYLAYQAMRWGWMLTLIGLAHRFLNRGSRFLSYANEASFPFYILHLPVDTVVGYFVIQMPSSIAVKFGLIVVITTLLTVAVYDVLVKRTRATRFLFGMKPAPIQAAVRPLEKRLA